jgi:hypothetical protein
VKLGWDLLSNSIVRNVLFVGSLFDLHVAKLFRVKNLSAFKTLHIFGVLVTGDNSNLGMFTDGRHLSGSE